MLCLGKSCLNLALCNVSVLNLWIMDLFRRGNYLIGVYFTLEENFQINQSVAVNKNLGL